MSPAEEAQQPRRVCLKASGALDAMRRHVGPRPTEAAVTRRNLAQLGASDRLGDVVASMVGEAIDPDAIPRDIRAMYRVDRMALHAMSAATGRHHALFVMRRDGR